LNESKTIITDSEKINRTDWGDFVYNHPEGNIFHTPEYFDLCNSTSFYKGIVICCLQERKISGILVAVIQREFAGLPGRMTARSVIIGGPLVKENDKDIAALIIQTYNDEIKTKVLFSQFRNLYDNSIYSAVLESEGYSFEEHLNILINLKNNKDQLWSGIHPTRRKQINRSLRREVITSVHSDIEMEQLQKCYVLLETIYRKTGLPLPCFDYFINAVKIFAEKKILKLFLAKYRSEIIGFRLVLCYKETIYDWYAAASLNHLDKYPNDVLPWEIFKWGNEAGYNVFDFGGAGNPSEAYGVRDYKLKFGGEVVNFGRFTKVHKPLTNNIIMILFKIRRKLLKMR